MTKKRKFVALLLVMCSIITLSPTFPLDEYEASEKVGTDLLDVLKVSYEELISGNFTDTGETYSCIIWIEDVHLEQAVEAGIDAAEMTRETYTENITYDYPYETYVINNVKYVQVELEDDEDDTYVQTYIEAERENAIELYTANNTSFVNENFMARDMSVVYVSQYSPCILADLNITKITNLLEKTDVEYIEYIDFKNLSITEATSENEIETTSTNISASSIENAMDWSYSN